MAELSVLDRLGCRSTRDEFRKRARALGVAVGEPVTSTGKRSYRKKADILEDCRRALTEKHSEVQQEAPLTGLLAHGLRKRLEPLPFSEALGLDVRHKQPDGNGWAWRSREDVLKDYARKLAEAGGATLPIGTGSVPQTAGASSAVLRNSSTVAPGSASAAVHGEVGTAASSRLGAVSCDLQVAPGSASASASDMEPQWLNFNSTGPVFCQPEDQATFHRVRTMRRLCRRLRSVQSLRM